MKQFAPLQSCDLNPPAAADCPDEVIARIRAAIASVRFGSVEVVIQDSRVVQIERTEKFRFDRSR